MRKLIASILTFAICLTSINSTIAMAATNETNQEMNSSLLSLKKSNFNYIEGKPGTVKKSGSLNSNIISSSLTSGSYQGYKVSNRKQISETNSQYLKSVTDIVYANGYEE